MNWPNWYVQLCCTGVLAIACAALVFLAVWLAGMALYRLWEFLKVEHVVIRAIGDHYKRKWRAAEDGESAETGRP